MKLNGDLDIDKIDDGAAGKGRRRRRGELSLFVLKVQ